MATSKWEVGNWSFWSCLIFLRLTNKSVKLMTANSQSAAKQEVKQRMMYMSRAVA